MSSYKRYQSITCFFEQSFLTITIAIGVSVVFRIIHLSESIVFSMLCIHPSSCQLHFKLEAGVLISNRNCLLGWLADPRGNGHPLLKTTIAIPAGLQPRPVCRLGKAESVSEGRPARPPSGRLRQTLPRRLLRAVLPGALRSFQLTLMSPDTSLAGLWM